jgi:hypothetical protein
VIGLLSTGRRLHDDRLVAIDPVDLEGRANDQRLVLGEVGEPPELRSLRGRQRRARVLAEERVLLGAELAQLAHRAGFDAVFRLIHSLR